MEPKLELSWLERLEPLLLLSAVAAGLALSQAAPQVAGRAEGLIIPALMVLLFAVFFRVPLDRLRAALGHRRYFRAALAINFIVTPLAAYGLGWLFLREAPALWVGLVLVLVTPCTDWYLVFTSLSRGDVPLNLALLPWNLVLQLVLLPFYLYLFARTLVPVELAVVGRSVLYFVVIPFLLAQGMRTLFASETNERRVVGLQYAALTVLIGAMFAHQGRVLFEQPLVLLKLVPPLVGFFLLLSAVAVLVGRWLAFSAPTRASLACTACARNSPLTLSLALVLFPGYPLVAVSQVIEPLLELPFLILLAWWLRRSR